jgi:hypothetical protein
MHQQKVEGDAISRSKGKVVLRKHMLDKYYRCWSLEEQIQTVVLE